MSVTDLYRERVLAHNRAPHRFGHLAAPTHAAEGDNPLCGDRLRCELVLAHERVQEHAFSGEACAIATATASMLDAHLRGLDATGLAVLERRFRALIEHDSADEDPQLGELNAMRELSRHRARHRCALLPFATVAAALRGESRVSTDA
jgi:nitrogen fixation NifU-like protein